MSYRRKINREELWKSLQAGMSVKELAERFGVAKQSIYEAIKNLEGRATEAVSLVKETTPVGDYGLVLVKEIFSDLRVMKDLQQLWFRYVKGDRVGFEKIQKKIQTKSLEEPGITGDGGRTEIGGKRKSKVSERVETYDSIADANMLVVQFTREKRELEKLLFDVMARIADMEQVAAFRRHTLDVIGRLNPDARDQIIIELERDDVAQGSFGGGLRKVGEAGA